MRLCLLQNRVAVRLIGENEMEHKKWKRIYIEKPKDKALCVSRISGESGYISSTIYDAETDTFRTYQALSNRVIITVWTHDEWRYADET